MNDTNDNLEGSNKELMSLDSTELVSQSQLEQLHIYKQKSKILEQRQGRTIARIAGFTVLFLILILLGFAMVQSIDFGTERKPLPLPILEFIYDLPIMMLAMGFGSLGGFVKLLMIEVRSNASARNHTAIVVVGSFVGLLSYFAIESQMLIKLMYQNIPDTPVEVTYKGIALIAALAGFLSVELSGFVTATAERHLANDENDRD